MSRRDRRRTRQRRRITAGIGALLVVGLGVGAWAWNRSATIPIASAKTAATVTKVDAARYTPGRDKPIFFLVIGNDYRPGVEGRRGDALHLVGYNPVTKQGAILNIPRDTTVPIPGNGTNKINAANAFGGAELTAKTVSQLTGVEIPYVIEADFEGFTGLIDDLGGIEIDVPARMNDSDSGTDFEPGRMKMNGNQALAFSRDRHSFANGDFSRTVNQGSVILGALRKVKAEANEPVGAFKALAAVSRRTKLQGLGLREFYDLMRLAATANPDQIKNVLVPVSMGGYQPTAEADSLFADFRDDATLQSH